MVLLTTLSVQDVKRKRSLTSWTEENMEQVVQHLPKELHASNRWVANILNMRRCTIQRILRGFSWDPYKVQVVQQLHEEDWENQPKPPN